MLMGHGTPPWLDLAAKRLRKIMSYALCHGDVELVELVLQQRGDLRLVDVPLLGCLQSLDLIAACALRHQHKLLLKLVAFADPLLVVSLARSVTDASSTALDDAMEFLVCKLLRGVYMSQHCSFCEHSCDRWSCPQPAQRNDASHIWICCNCQVGQRSSAAVIGKEIELDALRAVCSTLGSKEAGLLRALNLFVPCGIEEDWFVERPSTQEMVFGVQQLWHQHRRGLLEAMLREHILATQCPEGTLHFLVDQRKWECSHVKLHSVFHLPPGVTYHRLPGVQPFVFAAWGSEAENL